MSGEMAAPNFRLNHVPFHTLSLVTEWLSGHCIARLWFTGDKTLHHQFQRGGVKRFHVKVRSAINSTISLSLLSSFSNLETLIVSARHPDALNNSNILTSCYSNTILNLHVFPKSLREFRVRIPISVRTFATAPFGRVEYLDLKQMFPLMEIWDLSEAMFPIYEDMVPFMPQHLSSLHVLCSGADQELMEALPEKGATLEGLSLHISNAGFPRLVKSESVKLPESLRRLLWQHPWDSLTMLPPNLRELVLGCPFNDATPIHNTHTWQRVANLTALQRLELHLNSNAGGGGFGYGFGLATFHSPLFTPNEVFATLPRTLTSLTINYLPGLAQTQCTAENRLITMDCITMLPSTLLELTLAGFDVPLHFLPLLPCDHLQRLTIHPRGQPIHNGVMAGRRVNIGARYRVGRRGVPPIFIHKEDARYNDSIDVGGGGGYILGYGPDHLPRDAQQQQQNMAAHFAQPAQNRRQVRGRNAAAAAAVAAAANNAGGTVVPFRRGPATRRRVAMYNNRPQEDSDEEEGNSADEDNAMQEDEDDFVATVVEVESEEEIERKRPFVELTAEVVTALPATLLYLDMPHVNLSALEYLGPHTWPSRLGQLFVANIPLSYIPMLPQSLFLIDAVFIETNKAKLTSMDISEEQSSLNLPPLLHRLRCSLPSATCLQSKLKLPHSLMELDIAFRDMAPPASLDEDWSKFLPPRLRSLAVFGIGHLFFKQWFAHLPRTTLQELEMDVFALGVISGRVTKRESPIRTWEHLPPNLSHLVFRINTPLPFHVLEQLPANLEYLKVECRGSNSTLSIKHPEWIDQLPPRLRTITIPIKDSKQREAIPELLRTHGIDFFWSASHVEDQ